MPRTRPQSRETGYRMFRGKARASGGRSKDIKLVKHVAGLKAQEVVDNNMETKVAVYESNMITVNQDAFSTGILRIIPDIPHGVNSWQRTGQKIRVTKIVVQGHYINNFSGDPQAVAGNPITTEKLRFFTRRFVLKDKEHNDYRNVNSADMDFLLEEPAAVGQPYNGNTLRHNTPVNRGKFTVKKDDKKLVTTSFTQLQDATGSVSLYPTDNNIHFFKDEYNFGGNGLELLFDGSAHPINFPMFMTMGYCTPQNATAQSANNAIQLQYVATVYYKD